MRRVQVKNFFHTNPSIRFGRKPVRELGIQENQNPQYGVILCKFWIPYLTGLKPFALVVFTFLKVFEDVLKNRQVVLNSIAFGITLKREHQLSKSHVSYL